MSLEKSTGKTNTFNYLPSKLVNKVAESEIPLVLVLGWAGAVDANVYKYAKIYENYGYHTIRFAPTTQLTLFQTHLHKRYALELLDLIKIKLKLTENPIVFHTFSNAGLFIYRHITEIVHETENIEKYAFFHKNFVTLISDGGPGYPGSYSKLIENVTELMENHIRLKFIRYSLAIVGGIAFLVKNRMIFHQKNYFTSFFKALVDDKFQKPILIFYSKVDRLVSWETILEHVRLRLKQYPSIIIKTVEFTDTEHVMNYSKYPQFYLDHLRKHLLEQNLPIYDQNNESMKFLVSKL